jgi:signal transduction histidine kinase
MPLSLAAGFLFGPGIGGAIAFIGYVDPREFGGQISLVRALFNRAQTSLSVFVASLAFSLVGGNIGAWPSVGMAVLIAVPVDSLVNYALVTIAVSLHGRTSPRAALTGMRVGPPGSFVLTYISYGLLSVLLAEIYLKVGAWGLAAFAMPVLLARQALAQGRELEITGDRLRRQTAVLHDVSSRVVDERRDERLAVAAGLHDEVLPPLVKVHLMGQVIRHDLATGQLLALEEDVPDLLRAVEHASEAMRLLIRDLRDSALGTGGLADTVRRMAQDLEAESSARIEVEVEDVGGTPFVQLLTYHVAREALRNAVRHSGATWIHLYLAQDGQNLRLVVEDDGDGFVMAEVDVDRHFGVSLMRERVELAGGVLTIDSIPGSGTTVAARLPTGSF